MLSAQPSLDARQIERKQMKLAMSVGKTNHYRIDSVHGRHFKESAAAAGLPRALAQEAIEEIADNPTAALERVEDQLPDRFPISIHRSVSKAVLRRVTGLASA